MARGFLVLVDRMDVVHLVGVVVAVLVLAEVLEQILLALLLGDADEHLAVGGLAVLQVALVGVVGGGRLALLVLHQFEGRDITLALGDVDIQAVGLEPEHQFATLGEKLPIKLNGVQLKGAAQRQKHKQNLLHDCLFVMFDGKNVTISA